jgi:ketosteroid isomerase-like protein
VHLPPIRRPARGASHLRTHDQRREGQTYRKGTGFLGAVALLPQAWRDTAQAMSQENVEIVRGIYQEPDGITGAASERLAPDVRFDFTSAYPDRQILRGAAEVREFRKTGPWRGAPIHFEPERYFDVDDEHVLVLVRVSVVGTGSGAPVEMDVAHDFTVRDGLVVYFKVYGDRAEALEAAGLSR